MPSVHQAHRAESGGLILYIYTLESSRKTTHSSAIERKLVEGGGGRISALALKGSDLSCQFSKNSELYIHKTMLPRRIV